MSKMYNQIQMIDYKFNKLSSEMQEMYASSGTKSSGILQEQLI